MRKLATAFYTCLFYLLVIPLLFSISCGGSEDSPAPDPDPDDDDDDMEEVTEPLFPDIDLDGEPVEIIDLTETSGSTVLLLSNGDVYAAGTLVDQSNVFVKLYEDVKSIFPSENRVFSMVTNDDMLVTTRSISEGFDEVASDVKFSTSGRIREGATPVDYTFYVTNDDVLWLPEELMEQFGISEGSDPYQAAFNDVEKAFVCDYVTVPHLIVLKTDGTLWESMEGFINAQEFTREDVDAYYDTTDGILYQVASGLEDVDFGEGEGPQVIALNTTGDVLLSRKTIAIEEFFGIAFDQGSENIDDYLGYLTHPDLSGIKSIDAKFANYFVIDGSDNLLATGYNNSGVHGNGYDAKTEFTIVHEDVKIARMSGSHSVIQLNDNSIRTTGNNSHGQLGDGTNDNRGDFNRPNPEGGTPGGDETLVGIWYLPDGSSFDFRSDGTATLRLIDIHGICGDSQIPVTWSVETPGNVKLTNGAYTFCANTAFETRIDATPPADVPYTVSGNRLTLNDQVWCKNSPGSC